MRLRLIALITIIALLSTTISPFAEKASASTVNMFETYVPCLSRSAHACGSDATNVIDANDSTGITLAAFSSNLTTLNHLTLSKRNQGYFRVTSYRVRTNNASALRIVGYRDNNTLAYDFTPVNNTITTTNMRGISTLTLLNITGSPVTVYDWKMFGKYVDVSTESGVNLGTQLTTPSTGWVRFNDTDPAITYTGGFTHSNTAGYYQGDRHISATTGDEITIHFQGTRIRLIGDMGGVTTNSYDVSVYLDGVLVQSLDLGITPTQVLSSLIFEQLNLPDGEHTIRLVNNENKNFVLDAVDLPEGGTLLSERTELPPLDEATVISLNKGYNKVSSTLTVFSTRKKEHLVSGLLPYSYELTPTQN